MSTRDEILELLKERGELSSQGLAKHLSLTPMAVKLQLYELERKGLVKSSTSAPHARGRPSKLWKLTEKSDEFFPNAHAALSKDILVGIRRALGEKALSRVLDSRAEEQLTRYSQALKSLPSLRAKLEKLAKLRSDEGYIAEVETIDGSPALVENHCPICTAARECVELCASELEVFQKALGSKYSVERVEHIIEGARRCVYRIGRR